MAAKITFVRLNLALESPGWRSDDLAETDRAQQPPHLLVDSTSIKIYGEGEWFDQKHGVRSCRRWRKLHLAVAAVELTPDEAGDVSAVAGFLDQIEGPGGSMTGDGGYDSKTVYDAVAKRHPEAAVIIPPRSTAVSRATAATQRDKHLETSARHGRIGGQQSS